MNNKELKLCPFCGSHAEIIHYSDELLGIAKYARVRCKVCGAKGPGIRQALEYAADEKAVAAWNKRTEGQ